MNDNPYASPGTLDDPPREVVDRAARDALAAVIRRFLSGEVTAFEFDELLQEFYGSRDRTVALVPHLAWYHYDDCRDHLVSFSKEQWDYFQRLLLLLESDCHLETATARVWLASQLAACAALACFAWLARQLGWGAQLLALAVPFGFVSLCISLFRDETRNQVCDEPYRRILCPFATFAELRRAYDSAPTFLKSRYPRAIGERRIRSPRGEFAVYLQFYAAWLLLSPVALLVQMLPVTDTRTSVRAS